MFATDCPEGLQCVDGACGEFDLPDPDEGADVDDGDTPEDDADDVEVAEETDDPDADPDAEEVAAPPPAEFNEGCVTNEDCASGWCVDSIDGGYCTKSCTEGCPTGWSCKQITNTGVDTVVVCVRDQSKLCLPCVADAECGDGGADECLEIGGGNFCGRDCSQAECPTGYDCLEDQCVPTNGACDCTDASAGLVKGCAQSNDVGTCYGQSVCDPTQGWIACDAAVPAAELCDGLDNDCDGSTDEEIEPEPCQVANDAGICTGERTCQGPAGLVCSAATPAIEACNGLDDDCDGDADEGFVDPETGLIVHENHCGSCNNDCTIKYANAAEVTCVVQNGSPNCVIAACEPGFVLFNELTCLDENAILCQPCQVDDDCFGPGSKCLPVSDTSPLTFCARDCSGGGVFSEACPDGYACQPVDDAQLCMPINESCDCTPDNAGQQRACFVENGLGTCFGTETCDPALGWVGCDALEPAAEICNGEDDDCDGLLDEDVDSGAVCDVTNPFGTCAGVEVCLGVDGIGCSAPTPAEETCNGVDDDCNGSIDDGFAFEVDGVLKYGLSAQHCGACGFECPPVANGEAACLSTPEVPVCGVGECDEGFYAVQGLACAPVPTAGLCGPCAADTDCPGPKNFCLPDENNELYCAWDCETGSIFSTADTPCTGEVGVQGCCPSGFQCEAVGADKQCRPASGSCGCSVDGGVESCSVDNAFGSCLGTRTCDLAGSGTWTACSAATPGLEVCDEQDNDCDQKVDGQDDSLDFSTTPDGGAECSNGAGCPGQWQCLGGAWSCDAKTPSAETCNGVDDDCDGTVGSFWIRPTAGRVVWPVRCWCPTASRRRASWWMGRRRAWRFSVRRGTTRWMAGSCVRVCPTTCVSRVRRTRTAWCRRASV